MWLGLAHYLTGLRCLDGRAQRPVASKCAVLSSTTCRTVDGAGILLVNVKVDYRWIVRMSNVRVRFAPSPTGTLHVGNVRTALWNWLFARHSGGKLILRIEDTDKNREAPGGVEFIKNALRWYGIDWDEGPDVGGDYGPYVQSQRLDIYHKYAEQMIASGHAYRAYDTPQRLEKMRNDLAAQGLPTGYDRRHRYLTDEERRQYEESGAPSVVRLAVPTTGTTELVDAVYGKVSWENKVLEDAVLLKSDGYPTYHLAAMINDQLMEISHVFRDVVWLL